MKKSETIFDTSLWVLIFSNIVSIFLAIIQQWDIHQILWVYWAQSVTIGVVNFVRIRNLDGFSTKNFRMNNQPVLESDQTKRQVSNFFALHYGFFHLGYALFLWQAASFFDLATPDLMAVMLLALGFIGAHGFSYRHNIKRDFKHQKPNIGTLMFYPYLRIIPMHLIIIMGTFINTSVTLLIFMALKTLADGSMHMIEHHLFRKKSQ